MDSSHYVSFEKLENEGGSKGTIIYSDLLTCTCLNENCVIYSLYSFYFSFYGKSSCKCHLENWRMRGSKGAITYPAMAYIYTYYETMGGPFKRNCRLITIQLVFVSVLEVFTPTIIQTIRGKGIKKGLLLIRNWLTLVRIMTKRLSLTFRRRNCALYSQFIFISFLFWKSSHQFHSDIQEMSGPKGVITYSVFI